MIYCARGEQTNQIKIVLSWLKTNKQYGDVLNQMTKLNIS